jgi:hypothetical protein
MKLYRQTAEEKEAERRARAETHAAARAAWQASQAGTPRLADNPRRRRWLLLAAAACLVGSWVPLAVGAAFDVYGLLVWGVVSLYLGVGWVLPGVLVGVAAGDRARARHKRHPTWVGVAMGAASTIAFLILAALLAASGLDSDTATTTSQTSTQQLEPATSSRSDRVSLVMAAAQRKRATMGPVVWVECSKSTNFCAVAFEPPACQLWIVENVDGVDTPKPIGLAIEGGNGTYDEARDSVGCHTSASP